MDYSLSALQDLIQQYNQQRAARIQTAWDYYLNNTGKYYLQWTDETDRHYDERTKYSIPVCQGVVDTGVRWLYGKQQPTRTIQDESLNEVLQEDMLEHSRVEQLSRDWSVMGSVTGNAYVTLFWHADQGLVRWVVQDTESVYWVVDPDDVRGDPEFVILQRIEGHISGDEAADAAVRRSGVVTEEGVAMRTEIITPPQLNSSGQVIEPGIWHVYLNERRHQEEEWDGGQNPYPFVPVVNFINRAIPNSADGMSDIHAVIDMSQDYQERMSDESEIHKYHSFPIITLSGVGPGKVKRGPDRVWHLDPEQKADKIAGATGNETEGLREHQAKLREEIDISSGVPPITHGRVENIGQLSGLALQILYGPLIDSTEEKQFTYGLGERNLLAKSLMMWLYHVYHEHGESALIQDNEIEIGWADPRNMLPRSEKELLEVSALKIEMGLSTWKRELAVHYPDLTEEQLESLAAEIQEERTQMVTRRREVTPEEEEEVNQRLQEMMG